MTGKPWLTGWKEIANYCGISTQTAKRYEKKHKMTIYRLPGGTPVALPSQLDLWLIEVSEHIDNKEKCT